MKKWEDIKDEVLLPLSGLGAVLISIAAFIVGLYLLTVIVRLVLLF